MRRGFIGFLFACGLAAHAAPAQAATPGEADLIEACADALAAYRAIPTMSEQDFIASRDGMAGVWSTATNTNGILNQRLASDADYMAAHHQGNLPGDVAARANNDVNDCMIRRRLVQIAQGIPRPPPSVTQGPAAPAPNRQMAMNAPPKPKEDPDAPRKGEAGKPNPKELYRNKPAVAENASRCISLNQDPALFGGLVNSCGFDVYVAWCAYHPVKGAWSEAFDCDSGKGPRGGLSSVHAHVTEGAHTHNAERIFWFACRRPSFPKVQYTPGQGFMGHCE